MKSVCRRTRVTDPAGIWKFRNLIGAKVRISSMPISNLNFSFAFDSTSLYTIEDIYFRITTDGKTITVIEIEELPGYIFTWKDLEVIDVNCNPEPICGLSYCGPLTVC